MELVNEYASRHVQEFKDKISGVDRVTQLIDYAEKNPRLVAEVYLGYYHIIKDLVLVDNKDLEIIAVVNEKLSKTNKVAVFREIVASRGKDIITLAAEACNPESETYKVGIIELTEMMRNADTIKKGDPNAKPVDGDPKWDSVIWGYTMEQMIQSRIFIL